MEWLDFRFHPMRRRDAANVHVRIRFYQRTSTRAIDAQIEREKREKTQINRGVTARKTTRAFSAIEREGGEIPLRASNIYELLSPMEKEEANERRRKNLPLSLDVDEVFALSRRIRR